MRTTIATARPQDSVYGEIAREIARVTQDAQAVGLRQQHVRAVAHNARLLAQLDADGHVAGLWPHLRRADVRAAIAASFDEHEARMDELAGRFGVQPLPPGARRPSTARQQDLVTLSNTGLNHHLRYIAATLEKQAAYLPIATTSPAVPHVKPAMADRQICDSLNYDIVMLQAAAASMTYYWVMIALVPVDTEFLASIAVMLAFMQATKYAMGC